MMNETKVEQTSEREIVVTRTFNGMPNERVS